MDGPRLPAQLQTLLWLVRPIDFIERCRKRYGDTILLDLAPMGKTLFVSSPEAIRRVFTGDPEHLRAGEGNVVLRPIVGKQSLLILDGAEHLRHRRLLLPPFHGERMALYARAMRDLTEESLSRWPTGTPFSPRPFFRDITLGVILRTVFGFDEKAILAGEPSLADLLSEFADLGNSWVLFLPWLHKDLGPRSPWGRVRRLRAQTDRALYAEIARRRESGARGNDVLSLLLDARDESGAPMTDRELRDELVTLLLAGHETTATALEWALDRLLLEPRVAKKLEEEIADVAGRGPIEPEHIPKLEYLDAVVKEVLRLRPVLPNVARRLGEPMEIDGETVPAGWFVAPCIYLAHRREDVYPDALAFEPERFLGKKPDPYAWLPFGGGARRCIGMAFALLEMKVVLATLVQRATLRVPSARPAAITRRGITFSPSRFRVVREARAPDAVGAP